MNDREIKTRLCEILGTIDGFEWSATTAAYDPDSVGVWFGAIDDTPDRGVGVRLYGLGGSESDDLTQRKAQVWVRGAREERGSADDIADAVFGRFDKLSREEDSQHPPRIHVRSGFRRQRPRAAVGELPDHSRQ